MHDRDPTDVDPLQFMMIQYNLYKQADLFSEQEEDQVIQFLFTHLDQYGDAKKDIQKCLNYARGKNDKPGGHIIVARDGQEVVGAVILNQTGMEDYIPENILVYIATHHGYRGKGIGKKLMQMAIEHTDGNIALHVEPDNPAKILYEKLGFTNKYLEMRLTKK